MIEAKGTREEVKQFSKELTKEIGEIWGNIENGFVDFDDALFIVFERRGWITKHKWEQAYERAIKLSTSSACDEQINILHDRIVELEKKLKKGE